MRLGGDTGKRNGADQAFFPALISWMSDTKPLYAKAAPEFTAKMRSSGKGLHITTMPCTRQIPVRAMKAQCLFSLMASIKILQGVGGDDDADADLILF